MYTTPTGFDSAIKNRVKRGCLLSYTNDNGVTWTDASEYLEDGDVTCDRTAKTRWVSTIDLTKANSGFNIYTTHYKLTRVIKLPRLGVVYIPWGVYKLYKQPSTTSFTGYSLEKLVEDSRFLTPRKFLRCRLDELIPQLIHEVDPLVNIIWQTDKQRALVNTFVEERDRLGILMGSSQSGKPSISVSHSLDMFFNGNGDFVVRDIPQISLTDVAWELNGTYLESQIDQDRDQMYNVVVVFSSSMDPKRKLGPCFAYETDPTSPTYPGPNPLAYEKPGPFGIIPRFYASPLFTDSSQLQETASNLLKDSLMVKLTRDLTGLANDALEPGDTVKVGDEVFILDSWATKLSEHSMKYGVQSNKLGGSDIEIMEPMDETTN